MSDRRERWALAGILILYLSLGVAYSVVTPVFEAPDESHHFFVVKHIVDHRALPVQRAATRGLWAQEGSQPPIYYLIGALLVSGLDLTDAPDLLWHNPQANIGDPANPGNKNVFIHPPEQGLPWRGTVLAVHVLRFYSLTLGVGTVLLGWCTVRLLFHGSSILPLAAAAVMAFIPQFLFITASVNNDNAMVLLSTGSLYLMLRVLQDETPHMLGDGGSVKRWLGLGLVLGLALLSKLSALALLPLAGVVVVLVAWHRRSWQVGWRASLTVGLSIAAVAGWWYVRNVTLYGEPTGLTAMWEVVGRRDSFGQNLWGEFRALRYSFWGLFGWFSIALPSKVYRVLDVLSLLAVAGFCIEVGRWLSLGLWRASWSAFRYREPGWGAAYRPLGLSVMLLWLAAVFSALVRWTSLTPGTQGRLLFPALVSCVVVLVPGLRVWFLYRVRDAASVALATCAFLLAVATLRFWIAPAYARLVEHPSLPEDAVATDLVFGEAVALRGIGFEQEVVHPGEALVVKIYWEALHPLGPEDEFMVVLRLVDPNGDFVGVEDTFPGAGGAPASLWPSGRLLSSRETIRVGSDAAAPLIARLVIALVRTDGGASMSSPEGTNPIVARVKVAPRRWPKVSPRDIVARFDWGDGEDSGSPTGVRLAAFDLPTSVQAGEALLVELVWDVLSAPDRDHAVFLHLEDDAGNIVGYGDGAPRGGLYPTWIWEAGEVVTDDRPVRVSGDAQAGAYRLVVGLYDSAARVAAYGADGVRWMNDAVDLGVIEVR